MSESTKILVGDRRAVIHSRGIRRNITVAEHQVESDQHDVLEQIEAFQQTDLRGFEPLLIDGAGI